MAHWTTKPHDGMNIAVVGLVFPGKVGAWVHFEGLGHFTSLCLYFLTNKTKGAPCLSCMAQGSLHWLSTHPEQLPELGGLGGNS